MSAVLNADDRQGPEAFRIPEHGSTSLTEATNNEAKDSGQIEQEIRDHAEGRKEKAPWAPEGFYWGYNKQGDPVLKPHEWFVRNVATDAERRYARAAEKHCKSEELKEIIETAGDELRDYLQSRRALNEKAYARKLKGEADDAAYQIVQAAKYRLDGIAQMERNRSYGKAAVDDRVQNLRHYQENSEYEGYALTRIVLRAAEGGDVMPVFDYMNAAWRVCNFSASKLTEYFAAKTRNEKKADNLEEQASRQEAEAFFD